MGANIRSTYSYIPFWSPFVLIENTCKDDGQKLRRDFGILAENLVELGSFAHQADPDFSAIHKRQIVSLAKMVERYTSKDLDKGPVRSSDWERMPLSREQQECMHTHHSRESILTLRFCRCRQ